ncbi:MAG: hypothetical protein AB1472_00745 [Candidatus Omnitrophota bacterium]
MSIIFDALKKAQIKLSGNQRKDNPSPTKESSSQEQAKDSSAPEEPKVGGFKLGEDLTQPLKPIPGAKPIEKKVVILDKKDAEKPSIGKWVIYDVRKMSPAIFLLMVFFGLVGTALVFYIFNYKLKDKFIIKASPRQEMISPKGKGKPDANSKKKETVVVPIEKNIFNLGSGVSLSLDGIVSSEGTNLALIDNQVVQVGDTIKGALVVAISPNEVIVSFQGKEIPLTIK